MFIGPEGLTGAEAGRLRSRAAAAGISAEVRFAGELGEAATLMRGLDILLHPSRHEALPRVLIEALFAGLPAVAYSVGGVPEVVQDGETGLLVPPGNPVAFGAAALALARDAALRGRMSAAAKCRASDRFGSESMARKIRAIYAGLLPAARNGIIQAREPSR